MPASVRTLSQLPEITSTELTDKSKLEVSLPVEISVEGNTRLYKFASKSISAGALSEKIQRDVRDDLIQNNGLSAGLRVDELCTFVSAMANNDFTFHGEKTFTKDPLIDNSPLSGYALSNDDLNDYSVNYETLKKFTAINSAPAIGPNFGFVTRLSGIQGGGSQELSRILTIFKPEQVDGKWKFANVPYFVFNTNVKNVVPEEYIFRIERGQRMSKPWKAPASGIFTCYGWLDEMNNPAQSNESRWVALLGKQAQIGENGWTILQVQPFNKSNYISYVGFTFPVKKGMELKIMTGFAVGSNSDKYFASNSSIANHIGNAFLGGVYTGLSAYDEQGGNYDTSLNTGFASLSDLENVSAEIMRHETSCDDLSAKLVSDLSGDLSGYIDYLSGEIDKIPRGGTSSAPSMFIDPSKFDKSVSNGGTSSRSLLFGLPPNSPETYTGNEQYSYIYIGTEHSDKNVGYIEKATGYSYMLTNDPPNGTTNWTRITDKSPPELLRTNKKYYKPIDGPNGVGGNWFYTDDWFWYYTTPCDCFVHIVGFPDYAAQSHIAMQCYLKYINADHEPCFKMLGSAVEYGGTSDTLTNTSLPLKKGSTIAFGAYVRRETEHKNAKTQRFGGQDPYSNATYKIKIKSYKDDAKQRISSTEWRNFKTKSIPVIPTKKIGNGVAVASNNLLSISNVQLEGIVVKLNQTKGKCNVYVRLTDDDGNVRGKEQYLNAANGEKKKTLKWASDEESTNPITIGFGNTQHINLEIACGAPAEDSETEVWVRYLVASCDYRTTPINKNTLGGPCPNFNATKVSDLISGWNPKNGTASGQIVKPHERPSWLNVAQDRRLAAVSLMGLNP